MSHPSEKSFEDHARSANCSHQSDVPIPLDAAFLSQFVDKCHDRKSQSPPVAMKNASDDLSLSALSEFPDREVEDVSFARQHSDSTSSLEVSSYFRVPTPRGGYENTVEPFIMERADSSSLLDEDLLFKDIVIEKRPQDPHAGLSEPFPELWIVGDVVSSNFIEQVLGQVREEPCRKDGSVDESPCDETDSYTSKLSSDSDSDIAKETNPKALLIQILQSNNRRILRLILAQLSCPPLNSTGYRSCAGGSSDHQSGGVELAGFVGSLEAQVGQKRKRHQQTGSDDPDEEENERQPKSRQSQSKASEPLTSRFACPFFQNNRQKYISQRSCRGPGWPTVHRVKEHIYRSHPMPIHCIRCRAKFETNTELENHLQVAKDRICETNIDEAIEGFTRDQEKKMKDRSRVRGKTEVEKWKDLYLVLFPECDPENVPSPYHSDNVELLQYEKFLQQETPQRVRKHLEMNPPSYLRDTSEDLRRELLKQIPKLVMEIQLDLFQSFKKSQQQDNTTSSEASGPSNLGMQRCSRPTSHDFFSPSSPAQVEREYLIEEGQGYQEPGRGVIIAAENSLALHSTPFADGSANFDSTKGLTVGSSANAGLDLDTEDFLEILGDPSFSDMTNFDLTTFLALPEGPTDVV